MNKTSTSSSHVTDDSDVTKPLTSAATASSSTASIQPTAVDNEAAMENEICDMSIKATNVAPTGSSHVTDDNDVTEPSTSAAAASSSTASIQPPSVGIVWRGDSTKGTEDRRGAIWDHVQFRRCFAAVGLKHVPTYIITDGQVVSPEDIKKVEAGITEALQIKNPFPPGAIADIKMVTGVIFPGSNSDTKAEQNAISDVHKVVRTACNELGKPYLAVCAALYWLDKVNGLQLQGVQHHSHSGMVRHGNSFAVTHNALVHVVTLQPQSGLTGALQVNSIHNKGYKSVGSFETFALSGDVLPNKDGPTKKDGTPGKIGGPRHLSRSQTQMEPEKDVIEAFGSQDGKVTAVQWHMEAFHEDPAHFEFFKFVFGRLLTY